MISGIFHEGSGLGNQLHRYVATRVLALDKGYEFGMVNPHLFKGESFMTIDKGLTLTREEAMVRLDHAWEEKRVVENGIDIRSYDPEINFVEDSTIIDGEFQDERYFSHRLPEIREWLKVEPLDMPDDLCIINFRGGEFTIFPDLFLTKEYWDKALGLMNEKYPNMRYEVHTDDPETARGFFAADIPIVSNQQISHSLHTSMGFNWRSIRYAKHLILSNSSFPILPALLNEDVKEVIAPRYWSRRNIGVWALPQNYYKKFTYV